MTYRRITTASGIDIAYTDSGAPSHVPYVTIIAIHGASFCAPIFKKVQAAAGKDVRFVAINRRNYPGSTPFTPEEVYALTQGTKEQKDDFLKNRGLEIAEFIDNFIRSNNLPPITDDGGNGGIVLLGWSAGCSEANATIAYADTLPPDIQSRFSSYIRSLVLYEPGPRILGFPMPPKSWSPYLADCLSQELRSQALALWVTSYFDHGDLSTRDLDVLSYILPSTCRPGTLYNMSKSEQEETVFLGQESRLDGAYFFGFVEQFGDVYRKAILSETTAKLFPRMKIALITGDKSPALSITGFWDMQKDVDEKQCKTLIRFDIVPSINHFVHWDDPERALDIFLDCGRGFSINYLQRPGRYSERIFHWCNPRKYVCT